MSQRLSIGLLFGGESPEHEVSIVTARAIAEHLDPARFEVRPMGIARNGVWALLSTASGDPFARLAAGERPARGAHPFLPLEQFCGECGAARTTDPETDSAVTDAADTMWNAGRITKLPAAADPSANVLVGF